MLDLRNGDFVSVAMQGDCRLTVGTVEDYRGPHCFGVRRFGSPLNLPPIYFNAGMLRCHAPRVPEWENPQ